MTAIAKVFELRLLGFEIRDVIVEFFFPFSLESCLMLHKLQRAESSSPMQKDRGLVLFFV